MQQPKLICSTHKVIDADIVYTCSQSFFVTLQLCAHFFVHVDMFLYSLFIEYMYKLYVSLCTHTCVCLRVCLCVCMCLSASARVSHLPALALSTLTPNLQSFLPSLHPISPSISLRVSCSWPWNAPTFTIMSSIRAISKLVEYSLFLGTAGGPNQHSEDWAGLFLSLLATLMTNRFLGMEAVEFGRLLTCNQVPWACMLLSMLILQQTNMIADIE